MMKSTIYEEGLKGRPILKKQHFNNRKSFSFVALSKEPNEIIVKEQNEKFDGQIAHVSFNLNKMN